MALDNAQFISELSITDPPGTDPLSEGDDQIRTAKRTQFQTFPFMDKQVDLTADQLNDAALRSEANTFAAIQTYEARSIFQNNLTDWDAGGLTIGLRFFNGVNRAWQLSMEAEVADDFVFNRYVLAVLQDQPLTISNATGQLFAANSSAIIPSYSFQNAQDLGMFRAGGARLGFAAAGVVRMEVRDTGIQEFVQHQAVDGTEAAPGYGFVSNLGVGMARAGGSLTFAGDSGNPTLRIRSDGNINMDSLPLGAAGLQSGDLFRSDSATGFIEIVP